MYPALAGHWKSVPVLRLRGSRYLPLSVGSGRLILTGFDTLVAELLRRNKGKMVGPEAYNEREIRGLSSARFNTVKTL